MSAISEFLRKMLAFVISLLGGGAKVGGLDPTELTRAVVDAANAGAKRWDDQLDLPNAFDVRIPRADWDDYYGSRVTQTEMRLSSALRRFADEVGACMEEPEVSVVVDGSVPTGRVAVHASFSAPSELGKTPVFRDNRASARQGTTGWGSTPASEATGVPGVPHHAKPSAAPFDDHRDTRVEIDSVTPIMSRAATADAASSEHTVATSRPSAHVVVPSGPEFSVSAGSTVGIIRDPNRTLPDVELPYSEALRTCSQVQGSFVSLGAGRWAFEDSSRNGTRVLRGSKMSPVGGEPFALEDNDMLYFGDSDTPAVAFRAGVA